MYNECEDFSNKYDSSGFNWGACFLSILWGFFNNSYFPYLFIVFVPLIYWISFFVAMLYTFFSPNITVPKIIAMVFYLIIGYFCGINGNKDSLKNCEWKSFEEFKNVQNKWKYAGIIFFLFFIVSFFSKEIDFLILDFKYETRVFSESRNKYSTKRQEKECCDTNTKIIKSLVNNPSFKKMNNELKLKTIDSSLKIPRLGLTTSIGVGFSDQNVAINGRHFVCKIYFDNDGNVNSTLEKL